MTEPERPRLSWGSRLTLILGVLAGPLYVAWDAVPLHPQGAPGVLAATFQEQD